ncbi:hypothetical protein GFS24_11210 [Chitinophaga sp. SYP-B3965]|uniref:hypothetical protein n=1 Tax=Chitinophaga sp. SYP-B3965 TaxID=2663120 RepID=UPI001299820F|nr:hypothetical protein [Chitinophaga sp. SYP-B3965]MRG45687.1 hypothetical protein [Chitinophaga sp. SYP-B3965]
MNQKDVDKAKMDNDNNTELTEHERSFLDLVAQIMVEIVMEDDKDIEENIPGGESNQQ